MEKSKEFWFYDGSETVEPFRETVNSPYFTLKICAIQGEMDCLSFGSANLLASIGKVAPIEKKSAGR
jgi:hypothetical protein